MQTDKKLNEPVATATPSGTRYNRFPVEAERLGICVRSLATLTAERKIPHLKIGKLVLFDPVAVDAALVKFQVGAPPTRERRMLRTPTA